MKHLKIKLSVLALACLGAGALALQPTANVKAETPADCLTMVHGASVYVSPEGAEKDFNGIRWTTKIDATKYTEGEFGTLVLPTSMLGDDGVLTHDDADVLDLPANVDYEDLPEVFYSIVSYDELGANASAAYALELTARSYVKIGDDYYYASLEDVETSRSARQVALSTELDGEWGNDTYRANKAATYYGMAERYTPAVVSDGAAGTKYVDLSALATAKQTIRINVDLGIDAYNSKEDTGLEVMIGAQRITGTVIYTPAKPAVEADEEAGIAGSEAEPAELAFNIPKGAILPTGEHYISVFLPNGTIKTIPFICATKAITKAEDLAMFGAKGGYDAYSSKASAWDDGDYWRESQVQRGYYVLGKNIDASAYVHGSRNAADYEEVVGKAPTTEFNNGTWNGYTQYVGKPIGLTGTFNGMGYTIDSMTIGSEREGFFGIVNGGTVKNVAFDNVKATGSYNFIIANYLINATISDLYIATNAYDKDDKVNNPGYAYNKGTGIFGAYAVEDTKISNIFIRLNSSLSATPALTTFGALFGSTHADESYTCENVFVYSRQHVKYVVGTTTTVTDEATGETTEKTTYSSETVQYYMPMVTVAVPKVAKDDNKEYTIVSSKGTLYLAENQVKDADAAELEAYSAKITTDLYNLVVIKGVYTYPQSDKGHVSGTWTDHDYSAFWASGCWGEGSRGVAWKTL